MQKNAIVRLVLIAQLLTVVSAYPSVFSVNQVLASGTDIAVSISGPATFDPTVLFAMAKYTITVQNTQNQNVTGVAVEMDNIWNGINFIGSSGGQSSSNECYLSGSAIRCDNFNLNANQTKVLTILLAGHQNTAQGCGYTFVHRATLTGSVPSDQVSGNNSDTIETQTSCSRPHFNITVPNQFGIRPNEIAIWRVRIENTAEGVGSDGVLTFDIPDGFSFNASGSDNSCDVTNGKVECTGIIVAPNATKIINIALKASSEQHHFVNDLCEEFTLTASFRVAQTRQSFSDIGYAGYFCTYVFRPEYNFVATFNGPTIAKPGERIHFEISIDNRSNIDITKSLTFLRIENSEIAYIDSESTELCEATNGNPVNGVECIQMPLNKGVRKTYRFTYVVDVNTACFRTFDVQFYNALWDGEITPKSDIAPLAVQRTLYIDCPIPEPPEADVKITKSNAADIALGGLVDFELTVENRGPDTAQNVIVRDTIPSRLTFVSSSGPSQCFQQGAEVVCNAITLLDDQKEIYTLTFRVPSTLDACNTSFTNYAQVTSDTYDDSTANNADTTDPTQILCGEITVDKRSSDSTVNRGDTVTFTIKVDSKKSIGAQGVQVRDQIPAGLEYVIGSDNRCSKSGNDLICGPVDIVARGSVTFTPSFTVLGSALCAPITNIAIASATNSPNEAQDDAVITVQCAPPNLTIVKEVDTASVNAGESLTYTITVTNTGDSTANYVELIDTKPTNAGVTYKSGDKVPAGNIPSCTDRGTFVLCSVQELAPNATVQFVLRFDTNANLNCADGTINNRAKVEAVNAGRKEDTATTAILCNPEPNLVVTKSQSTSTVQPNEYVTYTILVENRGDGDAYDVVVTDIKPSGMTYVQNGSDSRCQEQGNAIVCGVSSPITIDAHDQDEFDIRFRYTPQN